MRDVGNRVGDEGSQAQTVRTAQAARAARGQREDSTHAHNPRLALSKRRESAGRRARATYRRERPLGQSGLLT